MIRSNFFHLALFAIVLFPLIGCQEKGATEYAELQRKQLEQQIVDGSGLGSTACPGCSDPLTDQGKTGLDAAKTAIAEKITEAKDAAMSGKERIADKATEAASDAKSALMDTKDAVEERLFYRAIFFQLVPAKC